jgi:hypothetical protein
MQKLADVRRKVASDGMSAAMEKEIKNYEEEIKALQNTYQIMTGSAFGATSNTQNYDELENEVTANLRKATKEQLEIERALIDDKERLRQYDYDNEIAALQAQKEARKERYGEDIMVGDIDLLIEKATERNNNERIAAEKEELTKILDEYKGYLTTRENLDEEYSKKKARMYEDDGTTLKKGVSQANIDELEYNRENALNSIDEQFAQREEQYQSWLTMIADMSLSELGMVLEQARKDLESLQKSGNTAAKQLAVAYAKVNTAQKAVNGFKVKASPEKNTIKEWEDLYGALVECERSFEDIGDAVGGTVGKIIDAAGSIMTSTINIINGIKTLTDASIKGTQQAAVTAGTAIKTVERHPLS